MSWQALSWATEIGETRKLPPAARLLLFVLANQAGREGDGLFPSVAWMAARTGLSDRTVQRLLGQFEDDGLIRRKRRYRQEDGARTSDEMQLVLSTQYALELPTTPSDTETPPGDTMSPPPGDTQGGRGVTPCHPIPKSIPKRKTLEGDKLPSPFTMAFDIYSKGIKARYGADYPRSAKAMGILSQISQRVGITELPKVVHAYLATKDPYHIKTKHRMELMLKDCEILLVEANAVHGTAAAPTVAKVSMAWGSGTTFPLEDVLPGDPLAIAKQAARKNSISITKRRPDYIDVVIGQQRSRFNIREITT